MSELETEITAAIAHPGSRTDAAARAAEQETPTEPAQIPEPASMAPLPVTPVAADEGVYRTMVLQASAVRQLLPQDPRRQRAVIIAIDNPVVLCSTKELAQAADNQVTNVPYPAGLYLPTGLALPVLNKGLVWAANTSGSEPSRIAVLVEYAEPGT